MSGEIRGVGIGLRRPFHEEIFRTTRTIDWLEIVSENFAGLGGRPAHLLARVVERWPTVAHGVALSVGGEDPVDEYLAALGPLVKRLRAPFVSDHLCYSAIGGRQMFDLLPLPFHDDAVAHVAARARIAQDRLETPLLLENITGYAVMPGSEMDEPSFLRAVLETAGCWLLLDVNNLYLNAVNHGLDPQALLERMPLERVKQIHLAGFTSDEGVLLDTHSRPVADAVWSLYRQALVRTGPVPTLIEWDQDIPSLDAVLDEADRARRILDERREAEPVHDGLPRDERADEVRP
jgi:uncharacterized protein (UPF0276 family)